MFRHTKIIATLGPACDSRESIERLMLAGANLFRLNFSHGDRQNKALQVQHIRDLATQHQVPLGILGDLQGPKIRTGKMRGGAVNLETGATVTLTSDLIEGDAARIPVNYASLSEEVAPGDRILLDDGLLELEVLVSEPPDVRCRILTGGVLKNRKGVNLPGAALSVPSLTDKDLEDADFAIRQGIDYLALSFVRRADDVRQLKTLLQEQNSAIPVIAKIEKPQAVENFDAILEEADAVMVARGDLGVEMPPERVPLIQKQIIRRCHDAGKPVITATQMLESMIHNPRPTRAETSDVANAILDGTDAVMLSGETATGSYPVEAVTLMDRVARSVESDTLLKQQLFYSFPALQEGPRKLSDAIGEAACRTAMNVGAAAILAFTQTGSTAAMVSRFRPEIPIYAVTPSRDVRRRLSLYAGVQSIRVDFTGDTESQIHSVEEAVLKAGVLKKGDIVIITMGSPVAAYGTTNLMKVHRLGTGEFYEIN
jgi:pyruvate kinase